MKVLSDALLAAWLVFTIACILSMVFFDLTAMWACQTGMWATLYFRKHIECLVLKEACETAKELVELLKKEREGKK